jgi:hypothetical protein
MEEVRSVGSVGFFLIEPYSTMTGGINKKKLKSNIAAIAMSVVATEGDSISMLAGGYTKPSITKINPAMIADGNVV